MITNQSRQNVHQLPTQFFKCRYEGEQQQRRDEVAAIKKMETKKQQRNLTYWNGVRVK